MNWEHGDSQWEQQTLVGADDFNAILFSFGKQGGRVREERQMATFRATLDDCSLSDLGFSSQWYTWERGQLASNNIRERLDRGVANVE
ncbi:reverse transcriptase [Gossypium australe]|uniref:Reverse transcriptase n=1 Tax=Gossypium australe TaxID=47621 RepID=A0A5B6UPE3_9ROSI|nr:reverse transcriptase [Gossypium australe]